MKFDTFFADVFGIDHFILTSSGSTAIIAALHALDVPRGSEVIVPAICCPAVLVATQMAGFKCILSDVDLDNFSIDINSIEAVRTNKTAAIIAVHGFGADCGMDRIMTYATKHCLKVVEDACLSYGNQSNGRPIGTIGDLGIISFGYDKPIDIGYGGAIIARSARLLKKAQKIINNNDFFRFDSEREFLIEHEFQKFRSNFEIRYENSRYLSHRLKGRFKYPVFQDIAYWRLPISVDGNREKLIASARDGDILFTKHYRSLEAFSSTNQLSNSNFIDKTIINLFVKPGTPKGYLDKSADLLMRRNINTDM